MKAASRRVSADPQSVRLARCGRALRRDAPFPLVLGVIRPYSRADAAGEAGSSGRRNRAGILTRFPALMSRDYC